MLVRKCQPGGPCRLRIAAPRCPAAPPPRTEILAIHRVGAQHWPNSLSVVEYPTVQCCAPTSDALIGKRGDSAANTPAHMAGQDVEGLPNLR
jgi:hypothetical protein